MRVYGEKKIVTKEAFLVETSCDLCKAIATRGCWDSSSRGTNEIEVTIKQKDGAAFSVSNSSAAVNLDLCPDCFENKLVPWLESQGADIG